MEEVAILEKLLQTESPILFLGAGFSIGAKLKKGSNFPKGDELKHLILTDFLKLDKMDDDYNELSTYSLSKACQFAKNTKGDNRLNDYLCDLLRDATPNSYHGLITSYNWRKIYTTNIDDIIESVYQSQSKDILVQNFYRKSTLTKSCPEYLKLHGCVNNPSEGFVFSTSEYVDSMTRPKDYRFNSLCFDMNSEDFIFLGSEFEEINIEYYLKLYESSGYKSTRGRLIFINPKPSLFLKTNIKRLGALLIPWTSEEFLNFLKDFYDRSIRVPATTNVNLKKSGFVNISHLKADDKNKINDSSLYFGYQPTWPDIFQDWDFNNADLLNEFNEFREYVERIGIGIFSICGKAFSGKSVFLKRLAVELHKKGYETYYFSGRNFNYYPFFQEISKSDAGYFALVIDDASYHYKAIKQLSRFNFRGKKFFIVTTSRPFYHYRKRYHFVEENFKEYFVNAELTSIYAHEIIKKLEEKSYLGELRKFKTLAEQVNQVLRHTDIFSLLSFITEGTGFKDRMLKEIVPLVKKEPLVNDLLLKTAIFEELDLPYFPKELTTYIYVEKTSYILSQADDFLKFDNKGDLQFRAKFYAKNLISANGKKKIIESIKDILIYISPQVSESNQRAGNSYWCEIQEALTKQRLLKNIFGLKNAEIKLMLFSLQSYYSENSHYWLQLGISEQNEGEYEKALNHFRQAEALNPHSYIVQHAIGRNFMKQANSMDSFAIASSYHLEGAKILTSLIKNNEEYTARAFSTHSYLNEELNFIERFNVNISNGHLRKLFEYLRKIIDKDPDDVMAKHMSNHFYKFLQRTNKLYIINIEFRDLSNFKSFFQDYNTNIEELLEEQDFF